MADSYFYCLRKMLCDKDFTTGTAFHFPKCLTRGFKKKPERSSSLLSQVCPFPRDVTFFPRWSLLTTISWSFHDCRADLSQQLIPPWLHRDCPYGHFHKQQTGTREAKTLLWCLCVCEEQPILLCSGEPEELRQSPG